MTDKLRDQVLEADRDLLYQIIANLIEKNPALESEVVFILNPKSLNQKLTDYQRIVNQAIDTTSYGHFPAKGIRGLNKVKSKFDEILSTKLYDEALKLGFCILNTIRKTRRKFNQQYTAEIEEVRKHVVDKIESKEFVVTKQLKLFERMKKDRFI